MAEERDDAPSDGSKKAKHYITPIAYADAHIPSPLLTEQARDIAYERLKKMVLQPWTDIPEMKSGWSKTPPEAFMGFTTVASSAKENTGTAHYPDGRLVNPVFHEIGLFQTPAGPSSGPAPNEDASLPNNAWTRLSSTEYVRGMLGGRDAVTGADAWKTAISDQVAIGLADLRANMRAISKGIGAAGVKDPSSTWSTALGFLGFSRGATPNINDIKPFIPQLAAVPEKQRFSKLAELIDQRDANSSNFRARGMILNAMRKFESGRLYAWHKSEAAGKAYDAWYDRPSINPEAWVAAGNRILAGQAPGSSSSSSGGSSLVMLVAVGVGAWLLLRNKS